jgi:hypothetical protein
MGSAGYGDGKKQESSAEEHRACLFVESRRVHL